MKWNHHSYPRGPRSCPSYVVSGRHHLIDPIRPTRGHIAISPRSGLYAMPSLCGSAEATRGWFRAFALHSFLTCRPLRPRGARSSFRSRTSMPTWPSPSSEQLGTPDPPAIRFTRGPYFGASWFTHLLRPVRLLAPLYGSDWNTQPPGAFTSRLSTARSPSPLLDMTTTVTGLLCWRDSHPLEWQLASLHQIRTGPIRAYGSHLRCVTAKRFSSRLAVCAPAPVTRLPGSESGACFAGAHSPWPPPFAPPAPRRSRPLCSSASQLLWQSLTSRDRASSATAPRLPDADRRRLPNGRSRDLPVPAQGASAHARFFDHAGSFGPCDGASETCCLPHSKRRRHPGIGFRGSMAGLCPPLPTLRRRPRGRQRTARGRRGSVG